MDRWHDGLRALLQEGSASTAEKLLLLSRELEAQASPPVKEQQQAQGQVRKQQQQRDDNTQPDEIFDFSPHSSTGAQPEDDGAAPGTKPKMVVSFVTSGEQQQQQQDMSARYVEAFGALRQASEALLELERRRARLLNVLQQVTDVALRSRSAEAEGAASARSEAEATRESVLNLIAVTEREQRENEAALVRLREKPANQVSLVGAAELTSKRARLAAQLSALRARERCIAESESTAKTDPLGEAAVAFGTAAEVMNAIVCFWEPQPPIGEYRREVEQWRLASSDLDPRDSTAESGLTGSSAEAAADLPLEEDSSDEEDGEDGDLVALTEAMSSSAAVAAISQVLRSVVSDSDRELSNLRVIEIYRTRLFDDRTLFSQITQQDAINIFGNSASLLASQELWAPQVSKAVADALPLLLDSAAFGPRLEDLFTVMSSSLEALPAVYTTYVANYSRQMITLTRCLQSERLQSVLASVQESTMAQSPLDLTSLLTVPLNTASKLRRQLKELHTLVSVESDSPKLLALVDRCLRQAADLATVVEQGLSSYHLDELRARIKWPQWKTLEKEVEEAVAESEAEKAKAMVWYAKHASELLSERSWDSRSLEFEGAISGLGVVSDGGAVPPKRFFRMLEGIGPNSSRFEVPVRGPSHYRLGGITEKRGAIFVLSDTLILTNQHKRDDDSTVSHDFITCIDLSWVQRLLQSSHRDANGYYSLRLILELPSLVLGKEATVSVDVFMSSSRVRSELRKVTAKAIRALRKQHLFGTSLRCQLEGSQPATGRYESSVDVPPLLDALASALREGNHLSEEGIFRLSSSHSAQEQLKQELNRRFIAAHGNGPMTANAAMQLTGDFAAALRGADTHLLAGLFKLFLRQLPHSLLTYALYDRLMEVGTQARMDVEASVVNTDTDVRRILEPHLPKVRKLIELLPRYHRATLQVVMELLHDVAEKKDRNKMTSQNLAIVFAPLLFRGKKSSGKNNRQSMSFMQAAVQTLVSQQSMFTIVAMLVDYYPDIFVRIIKDRTERQREQNEAKKQTMRDKRQQRVVGRVADVFPGASSPSLPTTSPTAPKVSRHEPSAAVGSPNSQQRPESALSLRLGDIVKQGFLQKKGQKRTNWKKRWFVLKSRYLYYFDKQSEEKPLDVVDLTNARCQPRFVPGAKVRPWQFVVISGSRELFVASPDQATAEEWIEVIRSSCVAQIDLMSSGGGAVTVTGAAQTTLVGHKSNKSLEIA